MKLYWLQATYNSHFCNVGVEVKHRNKEFTPKGESEIGIICSMNGDVVYVKFNYSEVEFELYLSELYVHAPRKGSMTRKGIKNRIRKSVEMCFNEKIRSY